LFAFCSRSVRHSRQENALILGSIEYLRHHHQQRHAAGYRPLLLALRDHLGELQPVALLQKLRAEELAMPESIGSGASFLLLARLVLKAAAVAIGALLIAVLLVLLVMAKLDTKDGL
jgi:hypothetical protein